MARNRAALAALMSAALTLLTLTVAPPAQAAAGQRLLLTTWYSTWWCGVGGCGTDQNSDDRDLGIFTVPDGGSVAVETENNPSHYTNSGTSHPPECQPASFTEVSAVDNYVITVVVKDSAGTEISRNRVFGGTYSDGTLTYRQEEYSRSQQTGQCEGPFVFTSESSYGGSYRFVDADAPLIDCGSFALTAAEHDRTVAALRDSGDWSDGEISWVEAHPCEFYGQQYEVDDPGLQLVDSDFSISVGPNNKLFQCGHFSFDHAIRFFGHVVAKVVVRQYACRNINDTTTPTPVELSDGNGGSPPAPEVRVEDSSWAAALVGVTTSDFAGHFEAEPPAGGPKSAWVINGKTTVSAFKMPFAPRVYTSRDTVSVSMFPR